jgi:hypothetical protein
MAEVLRVHHYTANIYLTTGACGQRLGGQHSVHLMVGFARKSGKHDPSKEKICEGCDQQFRAALVNAHPATRDLVATHLEGAPPA